MHRCRCPVRAKSSSRCTPAAITFDELTWPETWERDGRDRTPVIPSHEVSGVVAATADDVTEFAVGDEVYGLIRFDRDGAAAEYVTAPAADLAPRPDVGVPRRGRRSATGGADGMAGPRRPRRRPTRATSPRPRRRRRCRRTDRAARHAASEPTSPPPCAATRPATSPTRLGASHVVDTRVQPFDAPDACYDVVIDTVGGDTLDRSFEIVCPGGRLVTLSAPPPPGKADAFEIDATFFIVEPDQAALRQLAQYVDEATLHVAIARHLPPRRRPRRLRKRPPTRPAARQDRSHRPRLEKQKN